MKKQSNVLVGILLICLAAFLVLNQFEPFGGISVFRIVIAVVLLCAMICGIRERNFGGIFFPLAVLYIIFDDEIEELIGIPEISFWVVLLVAFLLTLGFSMIFPNWKREERWDDYGDENKQGEHQTIIDQNDNGRIFCENKFGATTRHIVTDPLVSAKLRNSFGEMKVYFDNAVVLDQVVEIDVQVNFGSMKLYVPGEWHIEQNINVFAADVKEEKRGMLAETKTIRLCGTVNFGELVIVYI